MKIGDVIRLNESSIKSQHIGIVLHCRWDNKLSQGGPVKMFTILWSNGRLGGLSEYFCKNAAGLEVISESR